MCPRRPTCLGGTHRHLPPFEMFLPLFLPGRRRGGYLHHTAPHLPACLGGDRLVGWEHTPTPLGTDHLTACLPACLQVNITPPPPPPAWEHTDPRVVVVGGLVTGNRPTGATWAPYLSSHHHLPPVTCHRPAGTGGLPACLPLPTHFSISLIPPTL